MPENEKKIDPKKIASIFIRTEQHRRDDFKEVAKKLELPYGAVIEKFMDYCISLGDDLAPIQSIVDNSFRASKGIRSMLAILARIIADFEEANHAFVSKRWVRAIESYQNVLDVVSSLENTLSENDARLLPSDKFGDWIRYRIAFCWLDVSCDRRISAIAALKLIKTKTKMLSPVDQYRLAIGALDRSIQLSEEIKSTQSSVCSVAKFNRVCALSLKAQYLTELMIVQSGDSHDIQNLLQEDESGSGGLYSVSVFDREYDKDATREEVDNVIVQIDAALELLKDLFQMSRDVDPNVNQSNNAPLSWLPSSLKRDRDLKFIRTFKVKPNLFNDYAKRLSGGGDPDALWCARQLGISLEP